MYFPGAGVVGEGVASQMAAQAPEKATALGEGSCEFGGRVRQDVAMYFALVRNPLNVGQEGYSGVHGEARVSRLTLAGGSDSSPRFY